MPRLRPRVSVKFTEPTMAQQQFKDECDINNIMARYLETGYINHLQTHGAHYGDMPTADDFQNAMNVVAESKSMFEELPSRARRYFQEDPANFLLFIEEEDPDTVARKFAELGLMREGYTYVPPSAENGPESSTGAPEAPIDTDVGSDD